MSAPQTPEERLREKIEALPIPQQPKVYGVHDGLTVGDFVDPILADAIFALFKAELGAAIGRDEPIHLPNRRVKYHVEKANIRNMFRAELRNHFGIGEIE